MSYYATANFLTDTLGIENPLPTRNAIHDRTEQTRGFGYLSYLVDDNTRLGLLAGTYEDGSRFRTTRAGAGVLVGWHERHRNWLQRTPVGGT